jgi:hypothetical protein
MIETDLWQQCDELGGDGHSNTRAPIDGAPLP